MACFLVERLWTLRNIISVQPFYAATTGIGEPGKATKLCGRFTGGPLPLGLLVFVPLSLLKTSACDVLCRTHDFHGSKPADDTFGRKDLWPPVLSSRKYLVHGTRLEGARNSPTTSVSSASAGS